MGRTLDAWLAYIERQHPRTIALGLERMRAVWARMGVALTGTILTVGGTNGKGSTAAMLEAILRAAGYRVGLYTSPHLLRYNERVRLDGREAADAELCEAFTAVERARAQTELTYFEYGTLGAAWLFARAAPDALVLEVGLGGRLDAVNLFDADCALLTRVAMDHMEYLGSTRAEIGYEKAGIFRAGRPAIVADDEPPDTVLQEAARVGARLQRIGEAFGYRDQGSQWEYWGPGGRRAGLAHPALRGATQLRNAAASIAALDALRDRLPVAAQDIRRGLAEVSLPGRFQVLPGRPQLILDVAHNPDAAAVLGRNLDALGGSRRTLAVFAMLRDKDLCGVAREIAGRIHAWHVASLAGPRGASADELAAAVLAECGTVPVTRHADPAAALAAAQAEAGSDDKILVFGSFLTVAAAMTRLHLEHHG